MSEWFETLKKKMKGKTAGDRKPLLIVGLGVVGMLCLTLSGGGTKTQKRNDVPDLSEAQTAVTRQLESLLRTVDGVGKVKVCVSVDRLQANVYAVNTEQTSEPDRSQKSEKYVFSKTGGSEQGLVLYTVMPEIRGVAVSCEGGGSLLIRQEVTRLIGAALGIPANRIWVAKMQS